MPQLGETVTEGTVSSWYKKVGEFVTADEPLLDIETDKVATEITAPVTGLVTDILVHAGETVEVGAVLAVIEQNGETIADKSQPVEAVGPASARGDAQPMGRESPAARRTRTRLSSDHGGSVLSPAVRRLLSEHQIAADAISGTGKGGRITRGDVLEYLCGDSGGRSKSHRPESGRTEVKRFSRVRRITAEHMVLSKATSPHVLQAVEVNFSAVDRARNQVREKWKQQHGFSLTYLPFVSFAVCAALREFPDLNSSVQGDGLLVHGNVNLAIAVDLGPEGLVAPVVPAADTLSVQELAHAIYRISARARDGKLENDELSGGTYTISNSGTFGTMITAPIINQPQVAILSVDGIRKRAVVVEGDGEDELAIRPVGILAQTFDHRAVDGAYSAAFLSAVRRRLESDQWKAAF